MVSIGKGKMVNIFRKVLVLLVFFFENEELSWPEINITYQNIISSYIGGHKDCPLVL
jgi:hypothetical protein